MYHRPKISVIIPSYNSEEYLKKAVESVINQTLKELEIILVDDGSSDKTPTLLQHYKMADNRVEVITHPKNMGLGPARNSGINQAKGKYLFFLDSDDYIHPNSFEVLYEQAEKEQLEILQAQHIRHENGKKEILPKNLPVFPQPINGTSYYNQGFFIEPKACAKLWQTDFVKNNGLKFDTGYYEDIAMVMYAFSIAKSVNNTQFPAYHYIIRQGSITGQTVTDKHIDGFKNGLIRLQQLFMNPAITGKNSSFPTQYFLYLKELSVLAIKTQNIDLQRNIKEFVEKTGQKYQKFLLSNRLLSMPKRLILKKSPYLYAKLKLKVGRY